MSNITQGIYPRGMTVIDSGTEQGIHWAICEAGLHGAINGYALVPEGHPWHGLGYDLIDADVHGGLTYSKGGWIGFDTLHLGDYWPDMPYRQYGDERHWTPGMVALEARKLAGLIAEAAEATS